MPTTRPLLEASAAPTSRRRSAPLHERTSDVTRPRGWLYGSLAGALGLALALVGDVGLGRGGTPLQAQSSWLSQLHPEPSFGRAHAQAGMTCASCHRHEGELALDPATACRDCHQAKRSTRGPHVRLQNAGTLQCTTCHPIHAAMGGVAFVPGAAPLRFRDGVEVPLSGEALGSGREVIELAASGSASFAPTSVALVELAACERCHHVARDTDPMAHCRLGDRHGPRDPVVCFDEHQTLAQAAASERAALWELAREGAALELPGDPLAPGPAPLVRVATYLGFGLGFAGLGFAGRRAWLRRRDRLVLGRLDPSASEPRERSASTAAPALRPAEHRRLPTIDATTCIGCNACVDACPYDVLELRSYVAVVARPDDCCGLTLCEQRCPNGSLVVLEGERVPDLPALDERLASRVAPGIFLAGDITGLPLIRNAINQGAHAVQAIAAELRERGRTRSELELVIVGAGPAGISAALEAKRLGLRYLVLEQASAAESIRSFPRGKLVFDQPLGMPMVGELWLQESTKEELLGKWLRIIRAEQLAIREGVRVSGVERRDEASLEVVTATGERLACSRVLLAFGRRGTPRKLDVPIADAMLDHVHYSLADARSFAGRRVLVVGLGDVAMEAAIALAGQPGTRVIVSYRGGEARRGKRRNVDELARLARVGKLELILHSEVVALEQGRVRLRTREGELERAVDSVFVMIGSVPPKGLLEACGVT